MLTIGIDPALNNVGYCILPNQGPAFVLTHTTDKKTQFQKMIAQRDYLSTTISQHAGQIKYAGIEQPYVRGAGPFGSGGHQSANMWAVYSMLLDVFATNHIPVVMFNITQFHSLIIRKRGLTKTEIVAKAKREQLHFGRIDQHSADAYFVAQNAQAFWRFMDAGKDAQRAVLNADQKDIFLSRRTNSSGLPTGIIWRPGDFWFDFRREDPTTRDSLPEGI